MIITCPNCQTSYQVAAKALGSAGRKVQCASCRRSWQARPEPEPVEERPKPVLVETASPQPDEMFSPEEEKALDKTFEEVANAESGDNRPATKTVDESETAEGSEKAKLHQKRFQAMLQRQKMFTDGLPVARLRRTARIGGLLLLVLLIASLYFFRVAIVRIAPNLAAFYGLAGIEVNIVGLEFKDLQTLRTIQDGSEQLTITATIVNVASAQVPVPPVVVTLLDAQGAALFEWSAVPEPRVMSAGEVYNFETQVSRPPLGFTSARLTFASRTANDAVGPGPQQQIQQGEE